MITTRGTKMTTEHNDTLDTVSLKLDIVLAKGFDCHVCSSISFSYNGVGLVFCNECGVTYHVDMLKEIYS